MAEGAEKAADEQRMALPVKDKQGQLIISEQQLRIQEGYNEHFKEVLNRPDPTEIAELSGADTDLKSTLK